MGKYAVLADTHAGTRNNSQVFLEHQIEFFEKTFFPYCQKHKIRKLLHLGDVFDRRKETSTLVLEQWDSRVFSRLASQFDEVHIIVGNHDTYWKDTNKVNSPAIFLSKYPNIRVYHEPTEVAFDKTKTLILPWICQENHDVATKAIELSNADLVLGHLELIGFPMFRGVDNVDKGFQPDVFDKFMLVLSGHFHIKSQKKNITYVGSPYPTTWAEYQDTRGFHVLDTDTLTLEFVEGDVNPFVYLTYDGIPPSIEVPLERKIVRLEVVKKDSEVDFLEFIERVESHNPSEVNVQEGCVSAKLDVGVDESYDMFSLMDLYVDTLQFDTPKDDLKRTLRELYHEALHLHDVSGE